MYEMRRIQLYLKISFRTVDPNNISMEIPLTKIWIEVDKHTRLLTAFTIGIDSP